MAVLLECRFSQINAVKNELIDRGIEYEEPISAADGTVTIRLPDIELDDVGRINGVINCYPDNQPELS